MTPAGGSRALHHGRQECSPSHSPVCLPCKVLSLSHDTQKCLGHQQGRAELWDCNSSPYYAWGSRLSPSSNSTLQSSGLVSLPF